MAAQEKLLVFVDLCDGALDEIGRGLLSWGARLAATLGMTWEVALPAQPGAEALADLCSFGTPAVFVIEGGESLKDAPGHLAQAVAELARARQAHVLVLPHNDLGGTLAPVAAFRLEAAIVSEAVQIRCGDDGIEITRQALGVRMAETRIWDREKTLVLTVPTRCLSQVLLPTVRPSAPVPESFVPAVPEGVTGRVTERIPPDPQTVDLTEAEVIFSAGKGCDQATFEQLKELCRLLNVSCGVTRPVYDLGWTGFERMVGQTGRTVTPRLYVALGISGSMHHVGGIKDSRRIVSVNTDPKAPIFPNSDQGYVADLKEILPRLIERAKSISGGAA